MEEIKFKANCTGNEIPIKIQRANNSTKWVLILTGDSPKGTNGMSFRNFTALFLNRGISVVSFDFQGLGDSDGERKTLTLTKAINDFYEMTDFIVNLYDIPYSNMGIFATSFGASVALCSSRLVNKACCLGLRSPAPFLAEAYINELSETEFNLWRTNQYSEVNGYNYEVLLDSLKYNIFQEAQKIDISTLIIHGEKDEIIPLSHSFMLFDIMTCKKEFAQIPNASHNYASLDGSNSIWDSMAVIFTDWFAKKLNIRSE